MLQHHFMIQVLGRTILMNTIQILSTTSHRKYQWLFLNVTRLAFRLNDSLPTSTQVKVKIKLDPRNMTLARQSLRNKIELSTSQKAISNGTYSNLPIEQKTNSQIDQFQDQANTNFQAHWPKAMYLVSFLKYPTAQWNSGTTEYQVLALTLKN